MSGENCSEDGPGFIECKRGPSQESLEESTVAVVVSRTILFVHDEGRFMSLGGQVDGYGTRRKQEVGCEDASCDINPRE